MVSLGQCTIDRIVTEVQDSYIWQNIISELGSCTMQSSTSTAKIVISIYIL